MENQDSQTKKWSCPSCHFTNEMTADICNYETAKPQDDTIEPVEQKPIKKQEISRETLAVIFQIIGAAIISTLLTWIFTPSDNIGLGLFLWVLFAFGFFALIHFSIAKSEAEDQRIRDIITLRRDNVKKEYGDAIKLLHTDDYKYCFALYDDYCKMTIAGMAKRIDFKDILWVELREDSNVVLQKSTANTIKRAIVGGILAGGAGSVIGGLSGSTKNDKIVSKIEIAIGVDNTQEPALYSVLYRRNEKVKAKDEIEVENARYRMVKTYARNVADALKSIIESNDKANSATIEVQSNTISLSISDEIIKAKSLLDSGAISSDDFELIKGKLLNK